MPQSQFCSEVIKSSGIAFGTSGARGLVEGFTHDVCVAFTLAFVDVMKGNFGFERIAIGIDRRPSSPAMASACIGAAQTAGLKVDFYGVLPTPALALQSMKDKIPAIMITGSHIPFDRNGIKFYRPDGEIDKQDEAMILASNALFLNSRPVDVTVNERASLGYLERNTQGLSRDLLKDMKIGLYEHSAAGRDLNRQIFESLGADVISLERTETFVPVDTEAVSEEDYAKGKAWSNEYKLDLIVSTDGDGDRPLVADENGYWVRGDVLGLIAARYLGIDALAVPVSCNSSIEASGMFGEVARTRIGSPYVIEGMKSLANNYQTVAGFEANGGFLLHTPAQFGDSMVAPLPTRDAILPALALIVSAKQQSMTPSQLVDKVSKRYTASGRLQACPTDQSRSLLQLWSQDTASFLAQLNIESEVADVNTIDGVRFTLTNGNVVHLRPSGNAPELRVYCEAATENSAKEMVEQHLKTLATLPELS
ncbi:MAG: phosphomannomutase [Pontibacterium sp.]